MAAEIVPGGKSKTFLLEHICLVLCSFLDSHGNKSPADSQVSNEGLARVQSPASSCDSARFRAGNRLVIQSSTSVPIWEAPEARITVNPSLQCFKGVVWAVIRCVCALGAGCCVHCGTPQVPSQRCRLYAQPIAPGRPRTNLVDPASSHMLVSKVKPCMSKYKLLYSETANGSLKQLLSPWQSSNLGYLW